ncbi:MAG: hypothetical protein ISS78_04080 [Phycisphaerae bacterium]|nr:hypothetical protein [Phycisphaerae bacterium]
MDEGRGGLEGAAADAYLEAAYVPTLNRRFTRRATSSVDAHRPIQGCDLAAVLSVQTVRTAANDYTVRHGGRRYQIERRSITGGLRGGKVIVEERLDGTHKIRFRGRYLRWHEIPAAVPPAAQARPGRKRRRRAATPASVPSASAAPRRPAKDHPWRQPFQTNRTFLLCGKEGSSTLR